MPLTCRAVSPTPVPLCLNPTRRKRQTWDTLEVVFSATGDSISVHSYGHHCSAPWDAALTHGRLESEWDDGAVVAIRPDERAWLDGIRTLVAGWLAAVETGDRSWMARAATRIQRFDDRSDGLIDLVIVWPPDRRW